MNSHWIVVYVELLAFEDVSWAQAKLVVNFSPYWVVFQAFAETCPVT